MRFRASLAASLSMSLLATNAALAEGKRVSIPHSNVSIEIPSSAELKEDEPPYADFFIYRVKVNDRQIVGVYIGLAPQTPNNEKPHDIKIGDCLVKSYSRVLPEGLSRDAYVSFSIPYNFPGFKPGDIPASGISKRTSHFFYRGLNPAEAKQADAIVNSITVHGAPACDRE